MEWTRVTTSHECYAVIHAAHPDLVPHSSFSDPNGSFSGALRGRMDTEWGFDGAPVPLIGASFMWDLVPGSDARKNEKRRYWLCVPIAEHGAAKGGE